MDETKKLYLFGPPQLLQNNREVTIGRRHSMALIAYLAIESGPHAREEIATFLWPGVSRDQARDSLLIVALRQQRVPLVDEEIKIISANSWGYHF